jgi:hypothetical protein
MVGMGSVLSRGGLVELQESVSRLHFFTTLQSQQQRVLERYFPRAITQTLFAVRTA